MLFGTPRRHKKRDKQPNYQKNGDMQSLSVQVEDQPYQEPDIDPTESQIQAIEKLAEELALLQTMIKRMPGMRFSSLLSKRGDRTPGQKLMDRLRYIIFLGGITSWLFAQISDKYLDIEPITKEFLTPLFSQFPYSYLFLLLGVYEFGKFRERKKAENKRKDQVHTLANKMIRQYLMCREILKQILKGRHLHSLTREQAKRLQIALGGETPPDGRLKHTLDFIRRFITRRKRHGHIYMPGFFNSAFNIDYMVRRFYESLGLTNYSQRAAQIDLDTEIKKYFQDHTWNHQFLSELIVDQQITAISNKDKKRFERLNRIRAELVAKQSMKPFHQQKYLPLEEVFPQLKSSKAPNEESNKKLGEMLANLIPRKKSNNQEKKPTIPSTINDKEAHEIVYQYLINRRDRRYVEGRNSSFSAGAVVGMLTKALLPDIDDEIKKIIEAEKKEKKERQLV